MWGNYINGSKDGWWLVYQNDYNEAGEKVSDNFQGWVLFDMGDVIEKESFGFTLGETNSKQQLIQELKLDSHDLSLFEEEGSVDDFEEKDLNFFQNKISGVE